MNRCEFIINEKQCDKDIQCEVCKYCIGHCLEHMQLLFGVKARFAWVDNGKASEIKVDKSKAA